jgi:hypothetical protein
MNVQQDRRGKKKHTDGQTSKVRAGLHAPIKSVSVPAAISVVMIFHASLWPGSTRGRNDSYRAGLRRRRDAGDSLDKYAGTVRRAGAHSSSM